MNLDVTITAIACPKSDEHLQEANVYLRRREDGSCFCPVHGDVRVKYPVRVGNGPLLSLLQIEDHFKYVEGRV